MLKICASFKRFFFTPEGDMWQDCPKGFWPHKGKRGRKRICRWFSL